MMKGILAGTLSLWAALSFAQDRPGIDRPIRVGSFLGTGSGRYWSTNIQTANTALGTLLANPDSAGLGPDLILPPRGFSFTKFGVTCQNCTPTAEQTNAFINALDTLDVVYIGNFVDLGSSIPEPRHREKLRTFMTTKAFLSVSRTTDTYGTWKDLDSIHGTRFQNHPSSQRQAMVRRDSVAETSADWKYLNRGLFQNGLDTTLLDYWYSWTTSGEVIRAGNPLGTMVITTRLPEETMQGGTGGARAMGDHPMSWGRRMRDGGRVFYTGLGHMVENYTGGPGKPRLLRRQIYNALLWVAKYDSLAGPPIGLPPREKVHRNDFTDLAIFPSALYVTVSRSGPHRVALLGLNGRRVAIREGEGLRGVRHHFSGLEPGVYILSLSNPWERMSRLVTVP